ncbi:unnamed protein product [Parajaminaea phylloscopi]
MAAARSSVSISSWSSAAKGKARACTQALTGSTASRCSPMSTSTAAAKPTAAPAPSSEPFPSSSSSTSASAPPTLNPATAGVPDTPTALALLKTQPSHYIVTSLVGRTFVLHPRDVVTIPRLKDVHVGDVLELDRIHEVGSRDYTLRAQDPMSSTRDRGASAFLRRSVQSGEGNSRIVQSLLAASEGSPDEVAPTPLKTSSTSWATRLLPSGLAHVGAVLPASSVRARAVVIEHTKGALERIVKRKRRKGYKKTIEHKQPYTRLRLEAIKIGDGQ